MSCSNGISLDITSDCSTAITGGLETKAWIFNRVDITPTYDVTSENKVTALAIACAKSSFVFQGVKDLLNVGHDVVVSPTRPDRYKHYASFEIFARQAANMLDADNLGDLVIVVENKDKETNCDGTFFIYGLQKGLYKTTDTQRAIADDGSRKIELASMDNGLEKHATYIFDAGTYAQTLAILVATETAVACP